MAFDTNLFADDVGRGAKAASPELDWETDKIAVLETNLDDINAEILGNFVETAFAAGTLDVFHTPIQMKKNRPGSLLRVIARPEDQERLAQIVLAETSTLGLRIHSAERRVMERHIVEVETPFGKIRVKVAAGGSFAPEYEDCREIAARTGTPLPQVLAAANEAYLRKTRG